MLSADLKPPGQNTCHVCACKKEQRLRPSFQPVFIWLSDTVCHSTGDVTGAVTLPRTSPIFTIDAKRLRDGMALLTWL